MDYHARKRIEDGVLRIHVDGYAFKEMLQNDHNLHMNLVMLGFHWQLTMLIHLKRFGLFTQCVLFFFIKNIIPPWMSIKREHIMLTMIIPGICLH
jgi:hypothetical protein